MTTVREMERMNVAPLFASLNRELVALLRSLGPDAWSRPTMAGRWRVRDVAAHLLDGDLRKLAAHRDGHLHVPDGHAPRSYAEVVALINSLNAGGVSYAQRLSARLLIELLEVTGKRVAEFVEVLDPAAKALFPVAWAGESVRISVDDAWRVFYNAVDRDRGETMLQIDGDRELGLHLLRARSVMV